MELRDYQDRFVRDIRAAIRHDNARNILGVLPTGGGKTVVASAIAKNVVAAEKRLWFICHRDFLADQTCKTFLANGLRCGLITADGRKEYLRQVQVCMIDTLKNRLKDDALIPPDVVIWDEAHHLKAETWLRVHSWLRDRGAIQIGLTATPERLDGRGLGPEPFETMVEGPDTAYLMSIGALSQYVAYAPTKPDMSGVKEDHGDYRHNDMVAAVRESAIVGNVVGFYRKYAQGLRTVYFAPSTEYSRELVEEFNGAGIRARHLDANTNTQERRAAAVAFANGELDVLSNVGLFGEGYDLAAQAGRDVTIEAVVQLRPTKSLALHRQQLGRALRPKATRAVLLDHAGNIEQHGLPDSPITWTLEGRKKNPPSSPLVRQCPFCLAVSPVSAVTCEDCGASLRSSGTGDGDGSGAERVDENGTLSEVDAETIHEKFRALAQAKAAKLEKERDMARAQTLGDWYDVAKKWGHRPGWGYYKYKATQEKIEAQAAAHLRK